MTDRKVHIRANVLTGNNVAYSLCSARPTGNGQVRRNSRSSYQFMASTIVSINEAAANYEDSEICAHCAAIAVERRNVQRKAKGWEPVSHWREKLTPINA